MNVSTRASIGGLASAALALTSLATLAIPGAYATTANAPVARPLASTPAKGSLCAPPLDTVGPTADAVSFGRSSIDVDSGSRVQTVAVDASDTSGDGAASGVKRVIMLVQGPDFFSNVRLALSSGTTTSGSWAGRFTVSKYARVGTYSIAELDVADAAGNDQIYPNYGKTPQSPDALSLHPADDPTFTVTGTPAKPPARKPAGTLSRFSISPAKVDTTRFGRSVHFTAHVAGPAPARMYVTVFDARRSDKTRFFYRGVRLTDRNGTWSGSIRIPRWLGDETLKTYVDARFGSRYKPGNRDYGPAALQKLHLPSSISVTSGVDRSRPVLTSLSFSPDPINSTTGAEKVTATATATDVGSGVHSVQISADIHNGSNGTVSGTYPYGGSGIGYLSDEGLDFRLTKTAQGTWVGSTVVRKCVPSGTYKVSAQLEDNAGNFRFYSHGQLAKAHITSAVAVTSKHGDIVAPYVFSAATYAPEHQVFLDFSEGVRNVDTSTLTLFARTPAATRYRATVPIGSIECANGTTIVDCSGANGLVTSAALTVPQLRSGTKYEVWANLDQVTPQLTDGNRNPMDWNSAAAEVLDS